MRSKLGKKLIILSIIIFILPSLLHAKSIRYEKFKLGDSNAKIQYIIKRYYKNWKINRKIKNRYIIDLKWQKIELNFNNTSKNLKSIKVFIYKIKKINFPDYITYLEGRYGKPAGYTDNNKLKPYWLFEKNRYKIEAVHLSDRIHKFRVEILFMDKK
jgi:hypothetical protein